jgi:hypothetical protein
MTTYSAVKEEEAEIKWILQPIYQEENFFIFLEGRAWVREKENDPWTLFDDQGNIIKEGFEAIRIGEYRNGAAVFQKSENTYGLLNLSGDVISLFYNNDKMHFGDCRDGLIKKKDKNGLFGLVDISGDWVISPDYDFIDASGNSYFNDGLCPVGKNEKKGYIDRNGNLSIDYKFDNAYDFLNGAAIVKLDSLIGVIDKNGDWIAEPIYEAYSYRYGGTDLIGLKKDGKIGFIDSKGNVVIDFKFYGGPVKGSIFTYTTFSEGKAIVYLKKNEYGIIDGGGNILFRINGEPRGVFNRGYLLFLENGGTPKIVDKDGNRYSLPQYLRSPTVEILPVNGVFIAAHYKNIARTGRAKMGAFIITNGKGER